MIDVTSSTNTIPSLKISPSILSADFSRLGEELARLENAGADLIHIDVMDGAFVPNITIGPPVIKRLRECTALPFDVHLMIQNPDRYIEAFADAGADIICVHAEACPHLNRVVQQIRSLGKSAAVALNPHTSLSTLDWIIDQLDMVLLMSVNPGFGGQQFIPSSLEKIKTLRSRCVQDGLTMDIEVDGGVSTANAGLLAAAGANVLVSGSALFGASDLAGEIRLMRKIAVQCMAI